MIHLLGLMKCNKAHQHVVADVFQLLLDLFPVLFGHRLLPVAALGLLLDARHHAPRGAAGTHHVLVGHRQEVTLLVGQLFAVLRHSLHRGGHVIITLGLLGQSGLLDQFFLGCLAHDCSLEEGKQRGQLEVNEVTGKTTDFFFFNWTSTNLVKYTSKKIFEEEKPSVLAQLNTLIDRCGSLISSPEKLPHHLNLSVIFTGQKEENTS